MFQKHHGGYTPQPLGSETNDDEIQRMIHEEAVAAIQTEIPEMFGSIKNTLIETFDERFTAVTEDVVTVATTAVAVARPQGGDSLLFQEFNNMKPPMFDGHRIRLL